MADLFFSGKSACCFTGHRPAGLPGGGDPCCAGMRRLLSLLNGSVRAAAEAGVGTFYAGGAAGFDALAADAVLCARSDFPNLRLVLALPSRTFLSTRAARDSEALGRIMERADDLYYASDADCSRAALLMRDRYMVEHADCCVAYLAHPSGGTAYTVRYALSRQIPVRNLADPLFDGLANTEKY